MEKKKSVESYGGFEQGPIRPPSEAQSLLIRITRNCPWNRCSFCPVYKGSKFSLRPFEHVIKDIDAVRECVNAIKEGTQSGGKAETSRLDPGAFYAAKNWLSGGGASIFIQDANSLIIKPDQMIKILGHMRKSFPWVERITSYARSHTVARIKDTDLSAMARAGLNRIHIGLESGSDTVLKNVVKGVDKATHIKAGKKIKKAGMELSEYVMPGLGGKEYTRDHALETADALNQIDPDFIRLRTLAIPGSLDMSRDIETGKFTKLSDVETAREILLFIQNLEGISSHIVSDHILNLFEDVKGRLPENKEKMVKILEEFLRMAPERQTVYQVGRRLGLFSGISDMESAALYKRAEEACKQFGVTPENADAVIHELMKRFI